MNPGSLSGNHEDDSNVTNLIKKLTAIHNVKWPIFHKVIANERIDQRPTDAYKIYISPEFNKKRRKRTRKSVLQ